MGSSSLCSEGPQSYQVDLVDHLKIASSKVFLKKELITSLTKVVLHPDGENLKFLESTVSRSSLVRICHQLHGRIMSNQIGP